MKVLILHGPNLNLLGTREPEIYGKMTFVELNQRLIKYSVEKNVNVKIIQSNHEGKLIDVIHKCRFWADAIVFNPGAFTHYSYALRDAISAVQIPTVEVHLSDLKKREKFRQVSVIKPVCLKQISGHGYLSYIKAIEFLNNKICDRRELK